MNEQITSRKFRLSRLGLVLLAGFGGAELVAGVLLGWLHPESVGTVCGSIATVGGYLAAFGGVAIAGQAGVDAVLARLGAPPRAGG